jgi:hypothetical protein
MIIRCYERIARVINAEAKQDGQDRQDKSNAERGMMKDE